MGVRAKNSGLVWVARYARAKPRAPRLPAHLQPKPRCILAVTDTRSAGRTSLGEEITYLPCHYSLASCKFRHI
jgi:hypothetical protein